MTVYSAKAQLKLALSLQQLHQRDATAKHEPIFPQFAFSIPTKRSKFPTWNQVVFTCSDL